MFAGLHAVCAISRVHTPGWAAQCGFASGYGPSQARPGTQIVHCHWQVPIKQSVNNQSVNQSINTATVVLLILAQPCFGDSKLHKAIHFDVWYFLLLLLLSGTYALLTCTSDSLLELCKASVRLCADHMYKCARSDSD